MTIHTAGIIGFGKMGTSFYPLLCETYGVMNVLVSNRSQEKMKDIPLECRFSPENTNLLIARSDIIFLAIKPQDFSEFAGHFTNKEFENKIIISVMAGITLENLEKNLRTQKIIRAMPNLGVQFAKGVVGWIASEQISAEEKNEIAQIFSLSGLSIELIQEEELDNLTPLSGSGPAYFFLLAQKMSEKAIRLGFSQKEAFEMVRITFLGSAKVIENTNDSFETLIKNVASKGGVTEKALHVFEEKEIGKIVDEAIEAGKKRNQEMNFS